VYIDSYELEEFESGILKWIWHKPNVKEMRNEYQIMLKSRKRKCLVEDVAVDKGIILKLVV
jgi:hypothetical protein